MSKNKNNQPIWSTRIKKSSSILFKKIGGSLLVDKRLFNEDIEIQEYKHPKWATLRLDVGRQSPATKASQHRELQQPSHMHSVHRRLKDRLR